MAARIALASTVILAMPQAANAQAYQCRVPQRLSAPPIVRDGPVRRTPVTGYTLAVSWSPEYCRGRERRAGDAIQCSGVNGSFGMVVHGLWPEGRGASPQWCPTPLRPTPADLARNLCMMPSARLQAREWAKHGTCMTRRPATYLNAARILWESLRWPDIDRLSREDPLTVGALRARISAANPGWPTSAIGVVVNERGWLRELRLCMDRRFRPAPCDRRRFGPPDGGKLRIWRGL